MIWSFFVRRNFLEKDSTIIMSEPEISRLSKVTEPMLFTHSHFIPSYVQVYIVWSMMQIIRAKLHGNFFHSYYI